MYYYVSLNCVEIFAYLFSTQFEKWTLILKIEIDIWIVFLNFRHKIVLVLSWASVRIWTVFIRRYYVLVSPILFQYGELGVYTVDIYIYELYSFSLHFYVQFRYNICMQSFNNYLLIKRNSVTSTSITFIHNLCSNIIKLILDV